MNDTTTRNTLRRRLPHKDSKLESKQITNEESSFNLKPPTKNNRPLNENLSKDNLHVSFACKPASSAFIITSARVDAFLAALGAASSLILLKYMQGLVNRVMNWDIQLSASFLTGSSIKFFLNHNPPNLNAFFWYSSALGIMIGSTIHFFISPITGVSSHINELVLFLTMFSWKLSGNVFSSTKGLAIYYIVRDIERKLSFNEYSIQMLKFTIGPYFLGNYILYGLALLMSRIRNNIRCKLIQRDFFMVEANYIATLSRREQKTRLRNLFNRMDLSNDGRLDAYEFKAVIMVALGEKISIADASTIMKSIDANGNGSLDFDQFSRVINNIIRR